MNSPLFLLLLLLLLVAVLLLFIVSVSQQENDIGFGGFGGWLFFTFQFFFRRNCRRDFGKSVLVCREFR